MGCTITETSLKVVHGFPQVPGQLLRQEDIGPELVGRRAEMLWPDDSQWCASKRLCHPHVL